MFSLVLKRKTWALGIQSGRRKASKATIRVSSVHTGQIIERASDGIWEVK